MKQVLISREELAKRWGIKSVQTIINYENDGLITRNPNIPTPRYSLNEIEQLEGCEITPLSPLERRRLSNQIKILEEEKNVLIEQIKKISAVNFESLSLLQSLS